MEADSVKFLIALDFFPENPFQNLEDVLNIHLDLFKAVIVPSVQVLVLFLHEFDGLDDGGNDEELGVVLYEQREEVDLTAVLPELDHGMQEGGHFAVVAARVLLMEVVLDVVEETYVALLRLLEFLGQ